MRTIAVRASLIAAALALAACSNAGADGEAPASASGSTSGTVAGTSSSAGTSSGSTASTTTGTTTTAEGAAPATSTSSRPRVPPTTPVEEHDQGVAWVPFGPATSNVPAPQPRLYGGLYVHDCDHSVDSADDFGENQQNLYKGALAACLAVADNAPGNWATAQDMLAKVSPARLDCMDSQALRLLQQLVAAHRRQPDRAPSIHPARQASACSTAITGAEVTDTGNVLVTGVKLWAVSSATIGTVAAAVVETNPKSVEIKPGAALTPGSKVTVRLVQGNLPPQSVKLTVPAVPPSSSSAAVSS